MAEHDFSTVVEDANGVFQKRQQNLSCLHAVVSGASVVASTESAPNMTASVDPSTEYDGSELTPVHDGYFLVVATVNITAGAKAGTVYEAAIRSNSSVDVARVFATAAHDSDKMVLTVCGCVACPTTPSPYTVSVKNNHGATTITVTVVFVMIRIA